MSENNLFTPITLGKVILKNRIAMAPMTRCRADNEHNPTPLMAQYYQQRANAGLIITEGTSPSPDGEGYARTPGIYTAKQQAGWKTITDAVHQAQGKIFLQMMHVGRIAHPLNKDKNAETVAPSAIKAAGQMYTDQEGLLDNTMPRALETNEISTVIHQYQQATKSAIDCGFDGVELHAANGYLPMQFLSSNSNQRKDQYGGPVENRIRFVLETLTAMIAAVGADKIGIRISPGGTFNDMNDANPNESYTTLLKALNPLNLAYVHAIRSPNPAVDAFGLLKEHYQGIKMINGGFNEQTGNAAIESGLADMISYGSLYISNPDLVDRFRKHAPVVKPHAETFYTPDSKGYTDYPPFNG